MADANELSIPVSVPHQRVYLRYSPLPRRGGGFRPATWKQADLAPDQAKPGWYRLSPASLNLGDGQYEYDFVVVRPDGSLLEAPDPFAEEITRFGGNRGVFHIRGGQRARPEFSWDGELPSGVRLPGNHEMVVYELPMRWIDPGEDGFTRQVGLGTFDKAIFELLDGQIRELGVNAIELLPVQDSPDTLNWGYGTRFFFAPDFEMGGPFDLKLLVKECHARGIRVILDVVMNHSKKCPLEVLARDWFYIDPDREEIDNGEKRPTWGGQAFRFQQPANGAYLAREFHYRMAEYWVREYHVDGFRIDEFKGINNWDFVREFRARALKEHAKLSSARPFIVIAEDSWRRAQATSGDYSPESPNPKVTDAIWDFDFRDEVRHLVSNTLATELGEPGRHERVEGLLTGEKLWAGDNWRGHGFSDLAQRITYVTSHDVEGEGERRLSSFYLDRVRSQWNEARQRLALDPADLPELETLAREMIVTSFALMLTCRGIPMFLAGEEFADLHDLEPWDWRRKMSDPVDWYRRYEPGHARVLARVKELVELRTEAAVLQRNELAFFGLNGIATGFQADFDTNDGGRVFAYCRPGGQPPGAAGQVAVVANCGWQRYDRFKLRWPWPAGLAIREYGGRGQGLPTVQQGEAELALDRFQARVFRVSAA